MRSGRSGRSSRQSKSCKAGTSGMGMAQELFPFARPRKVRPGKELGRPKNLESGVSHFTRAKVSRHEPQHVTVRLREGLPSLRSVAALHVLRRIFGEARDRLSMRICHWSIQSNHIHMIVEAEDSSSLSRGMNGLLTRISRGVNRLLGRTGRFFADRFHARALTCPRAVRNALAYVLRNAAHHGLRAGPVDDFSSGPYFDGWPEPIELLNEPPGPRPLEPPRSWLLCLGWRKHGPIPFAPG